MLAPAPHIKNAFTFKIIAARLTPRLVPILPLGVVSLAGFHPDVRKDSEKVANDYLYSLKQNLINKHCRKANP